MGALHGEPMTNTEDIILNYRFGQVILVLKKKILLSISAKRVTKRQHTISNLMRAFHWRKRIAGSKPPFLMQECIAEHKVVNPCQVMGNNGQKKNSFVFMPLWKGQ